MSQPLQVTTPAAVAAGPSINDMRRALYVWAKAVVGDGLQVIWVNQQGVKPPKPFVTLDIKGPYPSTGIAWSQDNHAAIGACERYVVTTETFTDAPKQAAEGTAEVLDASQYAADLRMSLDDPYLADGLHDAGMGVGPVNPAVDLSETLDTKDERRMSFDFEVNVIRVRPQSQDLTIETVPAPAATFN